MKEQSTHLESLDDLMASLFVLITHHSLAQSSETVPEIVNRIEELTRHPELEFFPNQQLVLLKMQKLWCSKLLDVQMSRVLH